MAKTTQFSDQQRLPLPSIAPTGGTQSVRDLGNDYWFGPLQPVKPQAPSQYRPRQWAYPPGSNIFWTPKAETGVTYEVLRALADSLDILRIVIEQQKDRLADTGYEIRPKMKPGESKKDRKKRMLEDPQLKELNQFWAYPDGHHEFNEWLRMWLEDMLVIDAVALYLERDTKGRLASIHPIAGDTINRLLTDQGFTPPPKSAAYQQIIYGVPVCDFTSDELVFHMRNERTNKRYGYSPVEQILITISIALRRQEFQLQYYTSGNMPEALCFLPADLPIDRIKEVQDWFDSLFAGDLAKRRRLTFLPGYGTSSASGGRGVKPNVVFPKEKLLKDEMDEWLARIVCFNIGVSVQPFVKQMNRAGAQQQQDTSEAEGKEPYVKSILAVLNRLLQQKMGFTEYEWARKDEREVDISKQTEVDVALTKNGLYTINEIREERGDDPRDEEEADMLGIVTATGWVPVSAEDKEALAPEPDPNAQQQVDENGNPIDPQQAQAQPKGKGKPNGKGNATTQAKGTLPPPTQTKPNGKGAGEKVMRAAGFEYGSPVTVGHVHFTSGANAEVKKHVPSKKGYIKGGELTPDSEVSRAHVSRAFKRAFAKERDIALEILKKRVNKVAKKFRKAGDDDPDAIADEIMSQIKVVSDELDDEILSSIVEAAISGVNNGLLQINVSDTSLISDANDAAREWAEEHAAQLVTGIDSTTRDELTGLISRAFESGARDQTLVEELKDAGTFSEARAEMIAKTEISRAQMQGNMELWKSSGMVEEVSWVMSEDHDVPDECDEYEMNSPYALGEAPMPIGDSHPNCECVLEITTLKGETNDTEEDSQ